MEALFEEKKRGKQESFKGRIQYKISYLMTLILYKTQDSTRIEMFRKIADLYSQGNAKNEIIYLWFQAIDGQELSKSISKEKFGFQKVVINVIMIILDKLEQHCRDNKERIEKNASIKNLVLLFKPLEECLQIVGPLNQLLQEGYRKRIHGILNQLRKMFPMDKTPECPVPYSLLESFYNLNLLIDVDFVKTSKIHFANYYKLYTIIEN